MPQSSFKVYPYRWVILAVFMFIQSDHTGSMDLFRTDYRSSSKVLRRF